jgi:hypothetical protein
MRHLPEGIVVSLSKNAKTPPPPRRGTPEAVVRTTALFYAIMTETAQVCEIFLAVIGYRVPANVVHVI